MKKTSLDISLSFKPIVGFFGRFHTIIFFVIVSIGLAVAIIMLISIIQLSSTSASSASNPVGGSFDQATIDKINQLGSNPKARSSSDRKSPFVE